MSEINDVQKRELRIKQDKLKTLIDITKLVDGSGVAAGVNIGNIINYANHEKNKLVLDLVNNLNITDFDESFFEEAYMKEVKCSIEECIDNVVNHKLDDNVVYSSLYDEFVSVLANYDICDLMENKIIHRYLLMIQSVSYCYDEIGAYNIRLNE